MFPNHIQRSYMRASQCVVHDALESNRHIDLLIANQSSRRILHTYMTFNELYAKIQSYPNVVLRISSWYPV